ncbi:nitrogenase-associated protein [Methylocella silvestris BL2]|uniref:Nitrogenase-associated protein n=1 Tax=Methylocella silvestris (strain DSM 15510 / CIP 108128 / LMG 27833 / NCIMB 13906 / BL2) TaxID=395965 RepID=B8ELS9_METSB|nr:ArsC/Spx/MgsR family protein [Methylocella silvestris]ACK50710.1 nitrogenase-associated protein [Methylocella silvestris BL2]
MTNVIFYEKPGCANNTKQKRLLEDAGHSLSVRNLLTEPWTSERLLGFFGDKPVAEWFNKAAPRVKSGEVNPQGLDAGAAIALMLAEPLLIRRPLMEADGARSVGFDPAHVDAWIGLGPKTADADLETCRREAAKAKAPALD